MNREDNSNQQIIDAIKRLHPESDAAFEPLGLGVAEDYAVVRGPAMLELVQRCKRCASYLPSTLQHAAGDWAANLDIEATSSYCSAISGYMANALLQTGDLAAVARIEDIGEAPVFKLSAPRGSALAREAHLATGGDICFGVAEIARHIAQRCEKTPRIGEIIWRCVARCLPGADDAVFPGIDIDASGNGWVAVRVRPLVLGTPERSTS